MSELKANFKFEIGDIVYLKTAANNRFATPQKLMICERILNQCEGGKQKFYKFPGDNSLIPELVLSKEKPKYERTGFESEVEKMQQIIKSRAE